jgi:putative ABC transport system permease protein
MALSDRVIVLRSMRTRMFSTVITVVTVAIAVALMLVLISMRDSGRQAFERGSGNMHLLISAESSRLVSVLNSVFYANPPSAPLRWIQYRRLERMPEVAYAVPVQQGDSYRGFPVTATTREFFTHFSPEPGYDAREGGEPWPIDEGRIFERPFEVVVGSRAKRASGLEVGDKLYLTHGVRDDPGAHEHREFTYEVVGILGPTGTAHDRALFTDLNSSWIIHAHDRLKRENPEHETTTEADLSDDDRLITSIYVRTVTRPGSSASVASQTLASSLTRGGGMTVASPATEIEKLFEIVSNIDRILLAMAGVVVVSSGIGIMLALYNSMEQRRRQIAVLRVLGCSAPRIIRLVLMEATAIGVLGAIAGAVLAVFGSGLAASVLRERLGVVVEPSIGPSWLAGVILGTVLLGALAGIAPALVAYRTGVAKNLKPIG